MDFFTHPILLFQHMLNINLPQTSKLTLNLTHYKCTKPEILVYLFLGWNRRGRGCQNTSTYMVFQLIYSAKMNIH